MHDADSQGCMHHIEHHHQSTAYPSAATQVDPRHALEMAKPSCASCKHGSAAPKERGSKFVICTG